jgi:hypothetical protein
MNSYTADALIEQPAIALLGRLGWKTANLRRTRDLLLPRLVSGEVAIEQVEIEG